MTPTNSTPAAPSGDNNRTRGRLVAASVKLLAEVRHLCDREGLDYGELDRAGYQQYSRERMAPTAGRIPRSAAQARALAEWAYDGPDAAPVELRLRGATLLAKQGDEGEAFNADGTPTEWTVNRAGDSELHETVEPAELTLQRQTPYITNSEGVSGDARSYSKTQIRAAIDSSLERILDAVDAGDTGARDLLQLLLNDALYLLANPDATLADTIGANYSEPPDTVLEWAREAA